MKTEVGVIIVEGEGRDIEEPQHVGCQGPREVGSGNGATEGPFMVQVDRIQTTGVQSILATKGCLAERPWQIRSTAGVRSKFPTGGPQDVEVAAPGV